MQIRIKQNRAVEQNRQEQIGTDRKKNRIEKAGIHQNKTEQSRTKQNRTEISLKPEKSKTENISNRKKKYSKKREKK